MAHTKPSHDLKLFLTTAALAATLFGWGALANREETAAVAVTVSNTADLTLPALPAVATVVPAGSQATNNSATGAAEVASVPTLRRVSAPPAPVTTTRSSR